MSFLLLALGCANLTAVGLVVRFGRRRTLRAQLRQRLEWIRCEVAA
jgi:hypothetical protein